MSIKASSRSGLFGTIKRLAKKSDKQAEQQQKDLDELNQWLDSQVLNDARKTILALAERIESLSARHGDNSHHLFRLVETLRPVITKRLQQIRTEFVMLAAADMLNFTTTLQQIDQLLAQMARAYAQVRDQLLANGSLDEVSTVEAHPDDSEQRAAELAKNREVTLISSYRATIYHAARLLQAWLSYNQPPPGLWQALHTCYLDAEGHNIADTEIPIEAQEREGLARPTVRNAYKRILIVAASNPYRMMRNEADMLFRFMSPCAYLCRIDKPDKENYRRGSIIINLHSDEGPFHLDKGLKGPASQFRILLPGGLSKYLLTAAAEATKKLGAIHKPTNEDRLRRDMILRAMRLWDPHGERKKKRFRAEGEAEVVISVQAASDRLFGEDQLPPKELDRRLRAKAQQSQAQRAQAQQPGATKWDTGAIAASASTAALPLDDDLDLVMTKEEAEADRRKTLVTWRRDEDPDFDRDEYIEHERMFHNIVDISEGGIMVHWDAGKPCTAQIGDAAAWRVTPRAPWTIGTVRWMYARPDGYDVGFMEFTEPVHACWLKTRINDRIKYFRGLIVGSEIPADADNRLVVPHGMMSTGQNVWLVQKRALAQITLLGQRGASPCITQYNFTVQTQWLDDDLQAEQEAEQRQGHQADTGPDAAQ